MSTRERSGTVVMHIDGGSRGNPGPAAFAVVVEDAQGAPLDAFSKSLGEVTNNVAEYEGLLAGLSYALRHHHPRIKVISDSELLVRQMQGRYKVKSQDLKPLHDQAQEMTRRLEAFTIEHVRREQNREADRLVNEALDTAESGLKKASLVRDLTVAARPLRVKAKFVQGALEFHTSLPLREGEEVDVEIRRKS